MDWKKAIGLGILLWVLMFVIVSAFISFEIYQYNTLKIVASIIAGLISFLMAWYWVQSQNVKLALGYGLSWIIIGVILDALLTIRFEPAIFSEWNLWASYVLVLTGPLVATGAKSQKKPPIETPQEPTAGE